MLCPWDVGRCWWCWRLMVCSLFCLWGRPESWARWGRHPWPHRRVCMAPSSPMRQFWGEKKKQKTLISLSSSQTLSPNSSNKKIMGLACVADSSCFFYFVLELSAACVQLAKWERPAGQNEFTSLLLLGYWNAVPPNRVYLPAFPSPLISLTLDVPRVS